MSRATGRAQREVVALRALEESLRAALEHCGVHRELARERRRQDRRGPRVPFTGFPPYQFGGNPTIPDWYAVLVYGGQRQPPGGPR